MILTFSRSSKFRAGASPDLYFFSVPSILSKSDANVNLVGVAATGAVGSFVARLSVPLVKVTATGAVGAFTPSVAHSLIKVTATGAAGSFTPNDLISLIGRSATGAVGTFGETVGSSPSLASAAASGLAGALYSSIAIEAGSLQGVSGIGNVSPIGSPTFVGVHGTGIAGTLHFLVTAAGDLVCASISLNPLVGGLPTITFEVIGTPGIVTEVIGTPAIMEC